MSDINSVVVAGHLVRDAAVSYLPNGTPKGEFSVAVNRSVKVGEEWQNEPSFLDVVSFGNRVENQRLNMTKGAKVVVVGALRQDRWKDNNGQNRRRIYIVADYVELMKGGQNVNQNSGQYQQNDNFSNGSFQEDIPFDN